MAALNRQLWVEASYEGVRLRLRDRAAVAVRTSGGARGQITELSEKSRTRLAVRAASIHAQGKKARVMVTLTYPGDLSGCWGGEAPGRAVKRHLKAFGSRLRRLFVLKGWGSFSALWFLEFQRRGAPHFHLILFDCEIAPKQMKVLQRELARAWAAVVAHPDPNEYRKHLRAGVGVERMRVDHFGYAKKYAQKMEQKAVPDGFGHVGRFWGCWGYSEPKPVFMAADLTPALVYPLARLAAGVGGHSSVMQDRVWRLVEVASGSLDLSKFGLFVWGADMAQLFLDAFLEAGQVGLPVPSNTRPDIVALTVPL